MSLGKKKSLHQAAASAAPVNTENFAPFLYTGTGSSAATTFTGVGFDPDMVWVKNRDSSGENHGLGDTVRGGGYLLYPNLTLAQATSDYIRPTTDGFIITTGNNNILNHDYIAWCWKAGGTAVSNTDGSITSSVSANTDAGFSIVKYTGNGGTSQSVGHGLSLAPELVIFKRTDAAVNWFVFEKSGASTRRFEGLNTSNASTSDTFFTPSASTITWTGTTGDFNGNTNEYIMYCFHSIDSYQKVGSYSGGSSSLINIGFRPRWIMIKAASTTSRWAIYDTIREPSGTIDQFLEADTSAAEATAGVPNYKIIFDDNGFKFDHTYGQLNGSGQTYIYLAIA